MQTVRLKAAVRNLEILNTTYKNLSFTDLIIGLKLKAKITAIVCAFVKKKRITYMFSKYGEIGHRISFKGKILLYNRDSDNIEYS